MKKKLNSKHESGITLIALIITIIVLLILAGVAIVTLTGDNGILGKASNAKIETEKGRLKETTSLAVSELVTEKLSTGGKTSDITAQNIVDKVKENEGKSEGITFEKREGATEPRNLPCYIVFDKSITSVKQTIKVPVELNLSVGSVTEGSYEDKAKKEIKEIIDKNKDITPSGIVDKMNKNHKTTNITKTSDTFPTIIQIPSKTYDDDQLEEINVPVSENKNVGKLYETTPTDYIPIYTKEQLKKISSGEDVNVTQEDKIYNYKRDGKYILMQDISLSGENWEPIPELVTTLEGNYKTISGMTINITKDGDYGLFGQLNQGELKNLDIKDVNIKVGVEKSTSANIGGAFGKLKTGAVTNCKTFGEADCKNVSGYTGGIVGTVESDAQGLVSNCINNINFTNGSSEIGGIIGSLSSNVACQSCINKGNIETSSSAAGIVGYVYTSKTVSIMKCKNTGNISSTNQNVGGIMGYVNCGLSISENENYGIISGKQNLGGIIGYLSSQGTAFITSNVNKGKIVGTSLMGGILGYGSANSTGEISLNACTNSGELMTSEGSSFSTNIGGIIGDVNYAKLSCNANNNEGKITINCSSNYIGGIIGQASNLTSGNINQCTNKKSATININSANGNVSIVGGCIGGIETSSSLNNHVNEAEITINSTSGKNYNIYSVGGVIGELKNSGGITTSTNSGNINIIGDVYSYDIGGIIGKSDNHSGLLVASTNDANITVKDYNKVSNIGGIVGNLYMNSNSKSNLITSLTSKKNIKLTTNTAVTGSNSLISSVGGLIGNMQSGDTISNSKHIGNIEANNAVLLGGLIGNSSGNSPVQYCYHVGDITCNGNSNDVGGFFGYGGSSIKQCYFHGNIVNDTNNAYFGAFAGYSSGLTLDSSYFNCKLNNQDIAKMNGDKTEDVSAYKLSDENAKKQESYTGFDFTSYWKWDETNQRPELK